MVESGGFYKTFIDPILNPMRKRVAAHIQSGQKIIDVACGTGAQIFEFAETSKIAVGVDLSESMIKTALNRKLEENISNVDFQTADATNLSQFKNQEFDIATLSLALHQFDPGLHPPILNELKRVAKKILIVDYSVPLPKNIAGYGSHFIEFLAGREHNRNFRKFYNLGGLEPILTNSE